MQIREVPCGSSIQQTDFAHNEMSLLESVLALMNRNCKFLATNNG